MHTLLTMFARVGISLLSLTLVVGCGDTSRRVDRDEFMRIAHPVTGTVRSTGTIRMESGRVFVDCWEMNLPTRSSRTITYYVPMAELTAADLQELRGRNHRPFAEDRSTTRPAFDPCP